MKLPQYSEVKPSARVWLGDVPAHWAVRRLKFQVNKVGSGVTPSGGAESYELEGIPLLRSQNVHFDGLRLDDVVFITSETHDSMANSKVQPNDVLLNITGASIGRCCTVPTAIGEANVNQHVAVVRSDSSIDPSFLNYLLRADPGQKQIELSQTGSGREGLTFEAIRNFVVPLPDLDEQQQIAAFLDWKTGQIDGLIGKKKELLEKLKEKRLAVITQAVTRGLNPAAPLKDSGIPWLGQVPEHWEIPALKFRYTVELGKMLDEKRLTGEHSIPYLRNVDVQWDQINYEDLPVMDIAPDEYSRYTIQDGDVLACEGGEVGRSAVVRGQFGVIGFQKAIHRLRADSEDELPTFVYYTLLWAVSTEVFSAEGSSTIAHLTADQLRRYRFPQPPLHEQETIVAYLDEKVGQMNKLAAKVESAIARLTEYRTALITAATTGKIDVRGVVVPEGSCQS